MTIKVDPEENEIGALFDFVNLAGRRVLEIGSGDCRLTWRYADRVEQVTAVEPFAPAITRAREQLPRELEGRVVLRTGDVRGVRGADPQVGLRCGDLFLVSLLYGARPHGTGPGGGTPLASAEWRADRHRASHW
jgi:hypothetical protein